MKTNSQLLRTMFTVGISFGVIWAVAWTLVGLILWAYDPDSVGPGESPFIIGLLTGFMGFLSGVAFWFLLSKFEQHKSLFDVSIWRIIFWGFLGSTIVQLGFLNHGDLGVLENMKQALLFIVFGVVAAITWAKMIRWWPLRRLILG